MNPFFLTDGYKTGHHLMYPKGTTLVYSNFTPRSGKYAPAGCDMVVSFGQQMVMQTIKELFDKHFFRRDEITGYYDFDQNTEPWKFNVKRMRDRVLGEIAEEYSMYLGYKYDVTHIGKLWDLGYLPIEVKALPEGTLVPFGVPVLTIKNTKPEFYWLTNFLETLISTLLWKPMTSATIAHQYKKNLTKWALKTDKDNVGFVEFQGHDFSMRGMDSVLAVVSSGLGHALSFLGSDSLPVIKGARHFYGHTGRDQGVVYSVNATEHAVMCAGTMEDEIGTFRNLMETFPTGILSIVSDTWDLWKVLTEHLPALKDEILARDGKLVIRPDSGDPADILCGNLNSLEESLRVKEKCKPENLGVVELLWDLFGGTVNDQGYKVLDSHIGAIYGDSITLDRAEDICKRLEAKGFASTNVVLGVGSFTYQYNTRDTFGFAMKATYCEVNPCDTGYSGACCEGDSPDCDNDVVIKREIYKDPVTDDGTKKSAKGLLQVYRVEGAHGTSNYILKDQATPEEEATGELKTIFKNGHALNLVTLDTLRERLQNVVSKSN